MIESARHFLLISALFFALPVMAQKGFQIHGGGTAGISFIAAQNDYDNSFYELDYANTLGYSGGLTLGYGFRRSIVGVAAEFSTSGIRQQYKGKFSPGLGFTGKGEHEKNVSLQYYNVGFYTRLAISFKDNFVYDTRVQGHVLTGFQLSMLGSADVEYKLDGNIEPYPSKLRPYVDDNYPYQPVEDDKKLFRKMSMTYVLQVGIDVFITDKLALSPAIRGHVAVWDINNKDYNLHEGKKSSRYYLGGLYLGAAYFFGRGY